MMLIYMNTMIIVALSAVFFFSIVSVPSSFVYEPTITHHSIKIKHLFYFFLPLTARTTPRRSFRRTMSVYPYSCRIMDTALCCPRPNSKQRYPPSASRWVKFSATAR